MRLGARGLAAMALAACSASSQPEPLRPTETTPNAVSAEPAAIAAVSAPPPAAAPAPAPLAATPCENAAPPLGTRVVQPGARTIKNAGAASCRTRRVELGSTHQGSIAQLSAGPQAVIAAWFDSESTVSARLLSLDLEPLTPAVQIGRFRGPSDIRVVGLESGGLVLTRSKEGDGDHWYASFLDGRGALSGPPVVTAIDPAQIVRAAFLSDSDTVHVVQHPLYLPGMVPATTKPIVSHLLSRKQPNVCPVQIPLRGYVDSRHDLAPIESAGGPGFLLRFVEGPDTPLPPFGKAKSMLVRHAQSGKDMTIVAGSDNGRLDFVTSVGTLELLRAEPIQLGSPVKELAPPVDLSPLVSAEAAGPGGLGDVIWTGKVSGLAVRALGSADVAKLVRIDCAP